MPLNPFNRFERRSRRGRYLKRKRRLNIFSRHHILVSPATPVFNSNPSLSQRADAAIAQICAFLFLGGIGEMCLHKCRLQTKKRLPFSSRLCKIFVAEREGFEPPEHRCSTVFKTAAFDHSAIFPGWWHKGNAFFHFYKKIVNLWS